MSRLSLRGGLINRIEASRAPMGEGGVLRTGAGDAIGRDWSALRIACCMQQVIDLERITA
jgi:hypothetical protein